MSNLNPHMIDLITNKCIETYMKLHKNGKPVEKEWTVLSCVLQYDEITSSLVIVSLGTGTKCIGATKMSPAGDLLNDSHAEVFARRGFLVYLYDNMEKALDEKCSIFTFLNNKFMLKENIQFYFYSSQLPCGDASILPKSVDDHDVGEVIKATKRQAEEEICDLEMKKPKTSSNDIHRTGAKCLPHSERDPNCPGLNYHVLGLVRTKPGRGDRTLSVSCSDKIARWIHLGIQGELIDMLLDKPIYINSFIFGAGVPYSEESLKRSFLKRSSNKTTLELIPKFYQSTVIFPYIRNEKNVRPSPCSIFWIKLNDIMIQEVAVQGRKLGLTKKKAASPVNSLCISKYHLYRRFLEIVQKQELHSSILKMSNTDDIPYNVMKRKSIRYLKKWEEVKESFFKMWTIKPDIFNFCVKVKR